MSINELNYEIMKVPQMVQFGGSPQKMPLAIIIEHSLVIVNLIQFNHLFLPPLPPPGLMSNRERRCEEREEVNEAVTEEEEEFIAVVEVEAEEECNRESLP